MLDLDKLSEKLINYKNRPTELVGRYVVNVIDNMHIKSRKICKINSVLLTGFRIDILGTTHIYNFTGTRKGRGGNLYEDVCYLLTDEELIILKKEIADSNTRKKLIDTIAKTNFTKLSTDKLTEIVRVIEIV